MRRLPAFFALRALEAAARHRSYSRAAEELAVTHSAVSQHIRGLESDLGAKLFTRRGNRMEPTPAAVGLAQDVRRALDILQAGVEVFAGAVAREPLVLSVGGYVARHWLPPRLPRLLADPAGAHLEIRVENRHVDFNAEEVDVGVRYGPGRWDGLDAQRLFPESLFPVCSPALAARTRFKEPADLAKAPLLHRTTRPWSLWFSHFGLETPPIAGPVFDDWAMALVAAAQGLGVALADESLVDGDLASGALVRPLEGSVVSDNAIYMVWRRDTRKLSRIRALRDWLLAEIEADQAGLASR